MKKITENAYAKINLGLEILGKRSDGYHEVSMVMQSLALCDEITIKAGKGIELDTNLPGLSCGPDNLAYKAAELLAKQFKINPNVHITLNKRIFMAAGLAGGSSDAAAVLRGLNRYWQLGLTFQQLEVLGAQLGSDIPFCIQGGSALAKGRGEILEPLPDMAETTVVLAKPKQLEISTAWVYKNYQPGRVIHHPTIWRLAELLPQGGNGLRPYMGNVLETVTIPAHPIIASIKAAMIGAGAYYTLMSGSGPTVFALVHSAEDAQKVVEALQEYNVETAITKTIGRIK